MPPGTDARTCETLHIKVIAVAPCHFREELRLRRGLHLVQRRKAAAVVSLKIVRGSPTEARNCFSALSPPSALPEPVTAFPMSRKSISACGGSGSAD